MADDENAKIRPGEKESCQPLAALCTYSKWAISGLLPFHRGDNAQLKWLSGWHAVPPWRMSDSAKVSIARIPVCTVSHGGKHRRPQRPVKQAILAMVRAVS